MSFWDSFQKDFKKNIKDGLDLVKERSTVVSKKLEKLTDEGKRKYNIFTLNMKVQEEFAKLGGQVYDLTMKKDKNPLSSKKVVSLIKKIQKYELQINKLEMKRAKKISARKPKSKSVKSVRRSK